VWWHTELNTKYQPCADGKLQDSFEIVKQVTIARNRLNTGRACAPPLQNGRDQVFGECINPCGVNVLYIVNLHIAVALAPSRGKIKPGE